MITIGTVFLFGLVGLAIEAGHSSYIKQPTQAAAESTANGTELSAGLFAKLYTRPNASASHGH